MDCPPLLEDEDGRGEVEGPPLSEDEDGRGEVEAPPLSEDEEGCRAKGKAAKIGLDNL